VAAGIVFERMAGPAESGDGAFIADRRRAGASVLLLAGLACCFRFPGDLAAGVAAEDRSVRGRIFVRRHSVGFGGASWFVAGD